jgi:4-carboxymuconolactone decarboxylase
MEVPICSELPLPSVSAIPGGSMSRLGPICVEELTPEQRRLHDEIMRTREKGLSGPFGVWLRNPSIAEPCEKLQNAFRLHSKLDRRVAELLVLLVARDWTAQYAWYLHEILALKAGLDPNTVAAIRDRRRPSALRDDERVVYDVVTELQTTKTVSAATYDRASQALGPEVLIEVVTAVGFYAMVCMTLNVFEVPLPADAMPIA